MKSSKEAVARVGQLIDDLKSDDDKKRKIAICSLPVIAKSLGPERTRLELVPFLNELFDDQDDVLLCLATNLQSLGEFIGGSLHANCLIEIYERLLYLEDSEVREKALNGLREVLTLYETKKKEGELISLVKRLANSDYSTAKSTSPGLIVIIAPYLSSSFHPDLYKYPLLFTGLMFKRTMVELAKSNIPNVRKAVSIALKNFIKLNISSEAELCALLELMVKDSQDFVKIFAVEALFAYAKLVGNNKIQPVVVPMFKQLAEDVSWRVRLSICSNIKAAGEAFGNKNSASIILPYYLRYLSDSEPELKAGAIQNMKDFAPFIFVDDIVNQVIPLLKTFTNSPDIFVRSALAGTILHLCNLVGRRATEDVIVPVFLTLVKDESPDVRLALFKNLGALNSVLPLDSLNSSILPVFQELASDKNWRMRLQTMDTFYLLATNMTEAFLKQPLSIKFLNDWLGDKYFAVREGAVNLTHRLCVALGQGFLEKTALPLLLSFQTSHHYLHRLTVVFGIESLGDILKLPIYQKSVHGALQILLKDPVPNVRYSTLVCISKLAEKMNEKALEEVLKKAALQLDEDPDLEVKKMAKALQSK